MKPFHERIANYSAKENTKHMNAEIIIREMELAAYEMAEAETCERRAHKLRLDATKRIASVRQDIILALEDAKARKEN